jgi:radical SAM superfamily enzyme YgiQ (UPF0313 family)
MMGCPGETAAQIESTLSLLRRLRPDHVFCSKYQPLPGTVLGDGAIPAPPVELERFDDYRRHPQIADPRCITGDSEEELFGKFDALRRELAERASMAPAPGHR